MDTIVRYTFDGNMIIEPSMLCEECHTESVKCNRIIKKDIIYDSICYDYPVSISKHVRGK
jgi:hypothetical protein